MQLTYKEWFKTQQTYIDVASERDKLLVEVSELEGALKGAALGHRKESGLLAADVEELRSEQEALVAEIDELKAENADLRARLGALTQDTPKVVAV